VTETLEIYQSEGPPSRDLAFERWLLERAAAGACCAFAYSWQGPVVVLGYAQNSNDVDLDWCRARSIPALRRLTGGTGVIYGGDLAVSLALSLKHEWARGVVSLYGRFLDVIEPALRSLGSGVVRKRDPRRASRVRSPICFLDQLSDTLLVDGRKAVGCAQTRRGGAVLIHAAILLGLNAALYEGVFGVAAEEVRRGLAPAVSGGDAREIGATVTAGLAAALGLVPAPRALPSIPEAVLEPYRSPRWAPLPDGSIT
jgi:lipoate-protein ligase A